MNQLWLVAAVLPSIAFASTVSDYTSQVRWTSHTGQLLYGGPCHATFGTTGVAPTKALAYTLSCPGYTEARIYIWMQTDIATVGEHTMMAPISGFTCENLSDGVKIFL